MILLDFNAMIIADVSVNEKYLDADPDINVIRNLFFRSVANYMRKYKSEYGNLVICIDSGNVWRKDIFPFYKANRNKKERDASGLDWEHIFECINIIKEDIKQYFPYYVMEVERCEADDIIGTLVEWHQENNLTQHGVIQRPEKFMILSADHDFIQLQQYDNVFQWSTIQKKKVKHPNPKKYLEEHIIRGDKGDGVPNVLTKDDSLVTGERQKAITEKFITPLLESNEIEENLNEDILIKYHRNKNMIDLSMIPQEYKDKIIHSFLEYELPRPNIMNYLIKNRLKNLMSSLQDF